jgi:hypothetical protein
MLLLHVRGATSFEYLRTVNGVLYLTFEETAKMLHLVDDDQEWDRSMSEAVLTEMPKQIRLLFATILINCGPTDPVGMWMKYRTDMAEDFQNRFKELTENEAINLALYEINLLLKSMGSSLDNFNIPLPQKTTNGQYISIVNANVGLIDYECIYTQMVQREQFHIMRLMLNPGQKEIYNRVQTALENNEPCLIYIPGSGGTGKTFLFKVLCLLIRSYEKSVLATAWTGNAATLLDGGQTCHATFGLPVPFLKDSTCRYSAGTRKANLIRHARAILCDEASIMPGHFLIELDRLCRFFTNVDEKFGGKIVLLSGDFRQTLPVCKRSTKTEIIAQCCNQHSLFLDNFSEIELKQNMRLEPGQENYLKWLNDLGNGQLYGFEGMHPDLIMIPENLVLQDRVIINSKGITKRIPACEKDLIDFVFESPFNVEATYTQSRAIFAPLNTDTMLINDIIFDLLPGRH